MKKTKLGKTGLSVSEISFGTAALGLPYGINVNRDNMPSEADSILLLHLALEKGINFFDTAAVYGTSEDVVGKAFGNHLREKAVICTKPKPIYNFYSGEKLPSNSEIRIMLEKAVHDNFSRLHTDYLDIYMSHDGTEEVIENETVIDFYQNLKKKGLIRATGISVYTAQQSLKAIQTGVWDVIQLAFNLMDQTQLAAIELAAQKGVGIVVRSVLFKGILTDKGDNLHPALKSVQEHRQKYYSLLSDHFKTLSALASKFALSCKGVSSVLVGIDKRSYLEQALAVADGNYLDEKTLIKAKQLAYPDPEFLNLPMWDRKGWLK